MYQTGSLDLHRKSMRSSVWADDVLWKAWCACLMLAYYYPYEKPIGNNQVLKLEPGQFTTGQFTFYLACYPDERNRPISSRTLWRKLFLLEKLGNLSIETSNKFSIITITNWAIYQPEFKGFVKPFDQNLSSACQADVKQVSTLRRNIKDKKKEEKDLCSADAEQATEPFYLTKRKRKLAKEKLESFNAFREAWNYQTPWNKAMPDAADAWLDIPQLTPSLVRQICEAAKAMGENRTLKQSDRDSTPIYPASWIRGRRWEDYDPAQQPAPVVDMWERLKQRSENAQ